MLVPRNILIAVAVLLVISAGTWRLLHSRNFYRYQRQAHNLTGQYTRSPRTATLIFVDITKSDTNLAWTQQPCRNLLIKALNSSFANGQNTVAAFLLHGRTRDAQPFWTNYPLSQPRNAAFADSAAMIAGALQQQACLEAFDSIATGRLLQANNVQDSVLTAATDILGALQQGALYFRAVATGPRDKKEIYLLCDAMENAGIGVPIVKTNRVPSKTDAEKWGAAALQQLRSETDVHNELEDADVYFLTPNNRLYDNEGRNLRRIFWENFLIKKLHCNQVYFF